MLNLATTFAFCNHIENVLNWFPNTYKLDSANVEDVFMTSDFYDYEVDRRREQKLHISLDNELTQRVQTLHPDFFCTHTRCYDEYQQFTREIFNSCLQITPTYKLNIEVLVITDDRHVLIQYYWLTRSEIVTKKSPMGYDDPMLMDRALIKDVISVMKVYIGSLPAYRLPYITNSIH